MDLETKLDILECYILSGKSSTAALRCYKKKYNLIKDPFSPATISKLMDKFYETGSLHDKLRPGRPSLVVNRKDEVSQSVQLTGSGDYQATSVRRISAACSVPSTFVHRILRQELRMWPYKISLQQHLEDADVDKRLQFSQWIRENAAYVPNILWSDECNFSLDGTINRHNCRIWCAVYPHAIQTTSLHSSHICV